MSKSTCLLALVALAAPLLADDAAEKKALDGLRGAWKLTRIEAAGADRELNGQNPRWRFDGKKVSYGGETFATVAADGSVDPKSIDLTLAGEKEAREGIYLVEGESLKICLNWDTGSLKERPREFSSKDKSTFRVLEFRRVKETEEDTGVRGFVGLQLKGDGERVVVVTTIEGTPARTAGFEADDVLLEVDGAKPADLQGAVNALRAAKPGTEIALAVERKGEKKEIKLKVGLVPMKLLID